MGDQDDRTQALQNKVDTIKALSVIAGSHNLTPPTKTSDDTEQSITIIKALSSAPRLQNIFLEAKGQVFDEKTGDIAQISEPIMNTAGAWKLVCHCKRIAQEAEWSNFAQEDIPSYADHFFKEIFPYFTFWHEDYELDPRNFDYVRNTLQMFILASFYKAKGGKYLNVLSKTYSEDFLGKSLQTEDAKKKKEGFLDRLNPLRKT